MPFRGSSSKTICTEVEDTFYEHQGSERLKLCPKAAMQVIGEHLTTLYQPIRLTGHLSGVTCCLPGNAQSMCLVIGSHTLLLPVHIT